MLIKENSEVLTSGQDFGAGVKKMGALVPMNAVYSAVYKMYRETIDDFADRHAKPTITFRAFSDALLNSECVSDIRTIRMKWDAAVAQGMLDTDGCRKGYTYAKLDASALRLRVKSYAHTHTQTSKKVRPQEEA